MFFLLLAGVNALSIWSDDNDALAWVTTNLNISQFDHEFISNESADLGDDYIGNVSVRGWNQSWLSFDDGGDNTLNTVDISGLGNLDISNDSDENFTILFWVNSSDGFFGLGEGTVDDYIRFYIDAGEVIMEDTDDNTINHDFNIAASQGYWQHGALRITTQNISKCLNGTCAVGVENPFGNVFVTKDLGIAKGGDNYTGFLDEFRIFNRSLEDWQIEEVYQQDFYGENKGVGVPVLYFHEVGENDSSQISNSTFSSMLDFIVNESGYECITTTEYYNWTQGKFTLPKRPIIIMFDDAADSVYDNAYSRMSNYDCEGVLPVPTSKPDILGGTMTWEEIVELKNAGWEIISHSSEHVRLDISNGFGTNESVHSNMSTSRDSITSNVSVTPITFVFPYNRFDLNSTEICQQYYEICTHTSALVNSTFSGELKFWYKGNNLTANGTADMHRLEVDVDTSIEDIKNVLTPYSSELIHLKLNTNTGTTAYDTSDYGNNGTITGATWSNDGIWNTLGEVADWTINTLSGLLTPASDYFYSYFNITYNQYNISNEASTFILLNNTNSSDSFDIVLDDLSNALIYNSNGSIYGSATISSNDRNLNITLPAGNETYILDQYNITQGQTRSNDPITLTTTSDNSAKTFTSTLEESVTQVSIDVAVTSCTSLGSITYNSNSGNYTDSWNGGDVTCSGNRLSLTINGIDVGANTLSISYNAASMDICEGFGEAGDTFVTFFVIIIIVSIAGVVMVMLFSGGENIDFGGLAFAIILAGVAISIGASIIFRIGGC